MTTDTAATWYDYYSSTFALFDFQNLDPERFFSMFGFQIKLTKPLMVLRDLFSEFLIEDLNDFDFDGRLREIQSSALRDDTILFSKGPYLGLDGVMLIGDEFE